MSRDVLKYPIGIQTFSKIIEEGYCYIDKTALIYKLVKSGKYYFLSRPRRFGKSLLLSTIEAYFEGRKELFKGLAMEKLEREWESYPVMYLSLAGYRTSDKNLKALLDNRLFEFEERFGVVKRTDDIAERFRNVIRAASESSGKKVVILIDEYDAPLVAHLDDDVNKDEVRDLLKSVYSNLKDMDRHINFAMLTGVSRFSRMTIFSGLNNLKDISLLPEWNEICGITESELKENFQTGITKLAERMNTDFKGALSLLKENYDGYHFTEDSADIYNPFSLLNALDDSKIAPYWFQTATPTFLIKYLGRFNEPLSEIFTENVSGAALTDIETYRVTPVALLFQTGYLTIKDYDRRRNSYLLGIPNKEVEVGLFSELLATNIQTEKYRLDKRLWDIRDAFEAGNPDLALEIIRSLFKGIPGTVTANHPEIFFENNLYLLFRLIGIDARAEWWTSDGRIDILLKTSAFIYVMKLKLDRSAEEALHQIDTKEYALPWKYDGRKVFKIGINFLSSSRNIDTWKINC